MIMTLRAISILVLSIRCTSQCIRCDVQNVVKVPNQLLNRQLHSTNNQRTCCPTFSQPPQAPHVLVWYGALSSPAGQTTKMFSNAVTNGQVYNDEGAAPLQHRFSFLTESPRHLEMDADSNSPIGLRQEKPYSNSQKSSMPFYSIQYGNSPLYLDLIVNNQKNLGDVRPELIIPVNNGRYNGSNTKIQIRLPYLTPESDPTLTIIPNHMVNKSIQTNQYPNNYHAGNVVGIEEYRQSSQQHYDGANVDIADDSRPSGERGQVRAPNAVPPHQLQIPASYNENIQHFAQESPGKLGVLPSTRNFDEPQRQENSHQGQRSEAPPLSPITTASEPSQKEYVSSNIPNRNESTSYEGWSEQSDKKVATIDSWVQAQLFPSSAHSLLTATPFQHALQSLPGHDFNNPQDLATSTLSPYIYDRGYSSAAANYHPISPLLRTSTVTSLSSARREDETNDISAKFSPAPFVSTSTFTSSFISSAQLHSTMGGDTSTYVASGNTYGSAIPTQTTFEELVQPNELAAQEQFLPTSSLYTQTSTERNFIVLSATDQLGFGDPQYDFESSINTVYGRYEKTHEPDAAHQRDPTYSHFSNGAKLLSMPITVVLLVFAV